MQARQPERLKRRQIPELPRIGLGLRSFPAWAVSLLLHVCLVVALGVFWTAVPRGTGGEPDRPVGVAVVYQSQSGEAYALLDSDDNESGSSDVASAEQALASSLEQSAEMLAAANAAALSALLPGSLEAGGASQTAAGGVGLSGGGAGIGGNREVPRVKTTVFGIEGEGTRFLYVFDRSASMNGFEGAPLREAKRELAESIQSLGEAHQFQVIFYNEYPTAFGSNSSRGVQLLKGTAASKRDALSFIRGIVADGSTGHIAALKMALSMNPDVVFFLTDADDPVPSRKELDSVYNSASRAGATIHAIQFGSGVQQNSGGWIEQLADQTFGKYRYINVAGF